ncbi:TasA family protein [Chloroflexota bacterium]
MKKIFGLTIAALLVIGMVSGGTWAYFSDTESSANNSLTAGTLDLNINGGNIAVTTFTAAAVAPGDSGSGNSTIANVGTMGGELDITFSAITNTGGVGGEYGDSVGNLGAAAEIAAYVDVDQSADWSAGDIGLKSDGTTYSFPTALDYATIDSYDSNSYDAVVAAMATSAADGFVVLWSVPTTAGNNIQGDSASFDITFVLEQDAVD